MKIALALFFVSLGFAQNQEVVLAQGAPQTAYEKVLGYTGTNLIYVCTSRSVLTTGQRRGISVSISAATNASPVVFTSTGHGFAVSARPQVTISGGTGNWTAVNGTFTATIVNANTFSIAVDSTAFGALTGTLIFYTSAPRSTVAEWAVQLFTYDGSSNLIWTGWLNGNSSYSSKCSEASLTTTNIQ